MWIVQNISDWLIVQEISDWLSVEEISDWLIVQEISDGLRVGLREEVEESRREGRQQPRLVIIQVTKLATILQFMPVL